MPDKGPPNNKGKKTCLFFMLGQPCLLTF
jgi:hypothetical protein